MNETFWVIVVCAIVVAGFFTFYEFDQWAARKREDERRLQDANWRLQHMKNCGRGSGDVCAIHKNPWAEK